MVFQVPRAEQFYYVEVCLCADDFHSFINHFIYTDTTILKKVGVGFSVGVLFCYCFSYHL